MLVLWWRQVIPGLQLDGAQLLSAPRRGEVQGRWAGHLAEGEDEEGDDDEEASGQEVGPAPSLVLGHVLGDSLSHVGHHNLCHAATCIPATPAHKRNPRRSIHAARTE